MDLVLKTRAMVFRVFGAIAEAILNPGVRTPWRW